MIESGGVPVFIEFLHCDIEEELKDETTEGRKRELRVLEARCQAEDATPKRYSLVYAQSLNSSGRGAYSPMQIDNLFQSLSRRSRKAMLFT